MAEKEKYIVGAKMSQSPNEGKKKRFILGDDTVGTNHLKNGCVTADKLSDNFIDDIVRKFSTEFIEAVAREIVAKSFGNSDAITISQKLLTDTINDIYRKIGKITGEDEVALTVTPDYFIGEDGATIHISAESIANRFEHVALYANDVLIPDSEADDVESVEMDVELSDTTVIKCIARVLGIDYTVERTVTRYNSMWMGAGTNYMDIMDTAHIIPIEGSIRKSYDVTCNEGDHFIFIVGEQLRQEFIRADLNGLEIQLTSEMVTIDDKNYWVLTSENEYHAGTYNIDING